MKKLAFVANDFLHQIVPEGLDRDEILTYALKRRKWESARFILEAMEEKDHFVVPAGEAFNKLFFHLLKEWARCRGEPGRERPIQKLMRTYIDICHRNSYGPLWITSRSIRYDDVFVSPI